MNSYKTKIPFWPNLRGYREIDLGLSRVYDLLARLDDPHLKLPPTIHIAGTNGKGSTLSFLKTIFEESGLKVHSYTSPHLVYFNERIKLAGVEISDQFLNEILRECQKAAERKPQIDITFFEGITVAAFLAFSKVKADILLLETGMGGKLDATNVLDEVLCSIITPISFDHTDFLGNTLDKIASEKAGIIKNNCPTFIGKQKSLALKTITNKAHQQKSETFIFNQNWKINKYNNHFLFDGFGRKYKLPIPSLQGEHQLENASLAIAVALNQNKFQISEENIKSALTKTFWPARLQKIEKGKFHKILPNNCEIYLDGSHNHQGSQTIYKFLEKQKNKKIFVIFAMLQDKDCNKFLEKIGPKIDHLFALEIANEAKSRKSEEIARIAKSFKIKTQISQNFEDSFANICSMIKNNEENLILICGSLYLAGSFLEQNHD
ncbi:MAG: bifunctional folylpolyglutamate synthase/dihydrofolate synthase [Pelagibacterales bacterium]|nr:bifunctional folylpolyglutamate synthase/dihydrofolate synthase [Pelagibacterales bacterium]